MAKVSVFYVCRDVTCTPSIQKDALGVSVIRYLHLPGNEYVRRRQQGFVKKTRRLVLGSRGGKRP